MAGSEMQRQEGLGLSCMRSFNRLATCAGLVMEKVEGLTMEGVGQEANQLVKQGAEAVGLARIDPLAAANEGVVGEAIKHRKSQIDNAAPQ